MSKIVRAINAMVSSPHLVTDVQKGYHDGELFFAFDKKHFWSISRFSGGTYELTFYTKENNSLESIANFPKGVRDSSECMVYGAEELNTREAESSIAELYIVVREKLLNMGDVLDEIILTDEIPF